MFGSNVPTAGGIYGQQANPYQLQTGGGIFINNINIINPGQLQSSHLSKPEINPSNNNVDILKLILNTLTSNGIISQNKADEILNPNFYNS